MKQAKYLAGAAILALSSITMGQYMAESMAALDMNNQIQGQMPGAMPGAVPGVGNPGAGFAGAPMGGNTMPGQMPGYDPAMMGMPGEMGMGMQGQMQPAIQLPDPIATADVLTGRRVFDAVSGALLEDAVRITVRAEDVDAYRTTDDGSADNGLVGDGIVGNVQTSRNEYIGYFSNTVKNKLIHAVHNAEQIDPMVYYGHHIAKINPTPVEGLKRYGLPLPEDNSMDGAGNIRVQRDFANIIDLERNRDALVQDWNNRFLARYRVDPNDPHSPYFAVFVPSPPLTPENYPVPTGYVAPQAVASAQKQQLDAATAAAAAQMTMGGGVSGGTGTAQTSQQTLGPGAAAGAMP